MIKTWGEGSNLKWKYVRNTDILEMSVSDIWKYLIKSEYLSVTNSQSNSSFSVLEIHHTRIPPMDLEIKMDKKIDGHQSAHTEVCFSSSLFSNKSSSIYVFMFALQ